MSTYDFYTEESHTDWKTIRPKYIYATDYENTR